MKRPVVTLAVFLLSAAAIAQDDAVVLRWRLAKGQLYEVTALTETKTTTVTTAQGVNEREVESEKEQLRLRVSVADMMPGGVAVLVMTVRGFEKVSVSEKRTMKIKAWRDENDEVKVETDIQSSNAMLKGPLMQSVVKGVGAGMLDLKIHAEISETGKVLSARTEGDPFAKLPSGNKMADFVGTIIREMISPQDLAALMTAEAFTQLPDKAVKPGESWPVERGMAFMGLKMTGRGEATLQPIEARADAVRIKERIDYKVDATEFGKMIKRLTESIFKFAGLPIQVSKAEFKVAGDVSVNSETIFMLAGHSGGTSWNGLTLPMTGSLTFLANGQESGAAMKITVDLNSKATWKKLK